MKKYLHISPIILILLFYSCKEHIKPEVQEALIKPPIGVEFNPVVADPYFTETTAINSKYGPKNITRNILQDKSGNIWLASWEGIIRYDQQSIDQRQEPFVNLTNKRRLRRFRAFTILEDKSGTLWFGTIGAGVYRFDGISFTNFTTKEGLVNDRVTCIYEDKAGNIWFGTAAGASCYDGKSFKNFTKVDGLTDDDINSIIEDRSGQFWFGTRGYACTYDGTNFTKFTNDEGIGFTNVRSIIEDKNGSIWLGGNDGLWKHNKSPIVTTNRFTNYKTDFVGYIYEDSQGNIWISSADGSPGEWAISRFDESSISSGSLTSTKVLQQENMFFGIVEDKDGGMWFGHLNGACRYDGESFNYFN